MKKRLADIEVKKPSAPLCLFILFNITYLFRVAGILSQVFYYATIVAYCGFCILLIIFQDKNKNVKKLGFFSGLTNVLVVVLAFWIISVIMQMWNGHTQLYLYTDLFELLMPALCVFCISNTDSDNFQVYIYILFIRAIFQFFIEGGANLSVEGILSLDWNDSASSLTETSASHIFCLLTIIFLYQKKYIPAIISTFLCILAFKRVAILVCLLSWIICRFIPNKKVNSFVVWGISILCMFAPLIVLMIYSDSGRELFYQLFDLDLNEFTMGRYNLVNETIAHFNGTYYGFGSVKEYFANRGGVYATLESFHCDILRIFLECTFVGVVIYVIAMMNIAKKSWRTLYLFAYLFIELVVSHFLGRFVEWIIFYMFSCYVENLSEVKSNNKQLSVNLLKHKSKNCYSN